MTNIKAENTAASEQITGDRKYSDGKPVMTTTAAHVHGKISTGYLDPAAKAYRAGQRGDPVRDNAPVHSKSTKRYGSHAPLGVTRDGK